MLTTSWQTTDVFLKWSPFHVLETLVGSACVDKTSDSWEAEFDCATSPLFQDKQPCYVLYQLASCNEWLMITYSPDDSPVSIDGLV